MKNTSTWRSGDKAPEFISTDNKGAALELKELLQKKQVLLVFYRGQWCPFCNKYLSQLQSELTTFQDKGVQVVLVTPEKPETALKTVGKTGVEFPIIWDEGYRIMKSYRVIFEEKGVMKWFHNTFYGADFKNSHGDEKVYLPVPATFLIGRDGRFKYIHHNPNFMDRAPIQEILKQL